MPYYGAIQYPIYKPAVRDILSITQAFPAVITTTFDGTTPGDHSYLSGLIVRLIIPNNYGMVQLNQMVFTITVLSASTFSIPIDTQLFDAFVIPVEVANQPLFNPAQVVPVGEETDTLKMTFRNVLTPEF
jgi:hypothetical protein